MNIELLYARLCLVVVVALFAWYLFYRADYDWVVFKKNSKEFWEKCKANFRKQMVESELIIDGWNARRRARRPPKEKSTEELVVEESE